MEPVRSHVITARDGWRLHVRDVGPLDGPGAVVVAGHAMMVDGRTLLRDDRPCLAWTLAAAGHRVLVPDLRGHGASGPTAAEGGRWTYEDLVGDVYEYVALAAQLAPGRPVALVGHSLFGHVSLVAAGLDPARIAWPRVCGLVALAADVWLPGAEAGAVVEWAKDRLIGVSSRVARRLGRIPARALRLGTCDEPADYWCFFERVRAGRFAAPEGTDYLAAMRRVSVPVLHVVSHGDHLLARPSSARALSARVPRADLLEVGRRAGPVGFGPGHVQIVTDPAAGRPVWHRIGAWIRRQADAARRALDGAAAPVP